MFADQEDPQEFLDLRDLKELLVLRDVKDLKDLRDRLDLKAFRELLEAQAPRDLRDLLDLLGLLAQMDPLDPWDPPVLVDPKEILVAVEMLVKPQTMSLYLTIVSELLRPLEAMLFSKLSISLLHLSPQRSLSLWLLPVRLQPLLQQTVLPSVFD